jgi:hypothetical protein
MGRTPAPAVATRANRVLPSKIARASAGRILATKPSLTGSLPRSFLQSGPHLSGEDRPDGVVGRLHYSLHLTLSAQFRCGFSASERLDISC